MCIKAMKRSMTNNLLSYQKLVLFLIFFDVTLSCNSNYKVQLPLMEEILVKDYILAQAALKVSLLLFILSYISIPPVLYFYPFFF